MTQILGTFKHSRQQDMDGCLFLFEYSYLSKVNVGSLNCSSFLCPGLLQREHDAAVVYGSIDTGKSIKVDDEFKVKVCFKWIEAFRIIFI